VDASGRRSPRRLAALELTLNRAEVEVDDRLRSDERRPNRWPTD
jgi:hypothetical protein